MNLLRFLLLLLPLGAHAGAVKARDPTCPVSSCVNAAPILPKQDPWYVTPPANLDSLAPGAVARMRKAPGNLTSIIANCSEAYNILYRTTDSQYNATWAVATLLVPPPTAPAFGNVLLSYQTAYDTVDLNDSPSYTLYTEAVDTYVTMALGRGWHVIFGDYEGPLASFTAGVISGHAVLDGVRAVLSLSESCIGLKQSAKTALWGYSGGALASEWAAEMQLDYAPELSFTAAALGGLTPNVTSIRYAVEGTVSAGLIPSWLIGTGTQFPELWTYAQSKLKMTGPYNVTAWLEMPDDITTGATFAFQNISDYFLDGFADLEGVPIVDQVTQSDGIMGFHGIPQMQIYAYKAIQDELSPVADTDELISRYCGLGADILYVKDTVNDHADEFIAGDPRAYSWLVSALEEGAQVTGCMTQTITDPLPTAG